MSCLSFTYAPTVSDTVHAGQCCRRAVEPLKKASIQLIQHAREARVQNLAAALKHFLFTILIKVPIEQSEGAAAYRSLTKY